MQYRDVCFDPVYTPADLPRFFPRLALEFGDNVTLDLPPQNYMFMASKANTYCLGIFDNGRKGTLLGGILFRDVLVQVSPRPSMTVTCCYMRPPVHGSLLLLVKKLIFRPRSIGSNRFVNTFNL